MKRHLAPLFFASVASAGLATAQTPVSISADITQAYTAVKANILRTADKMPDANYSFKPTPGIRTFAEVLDHIADSQMRTCAAVAGDQQTFSAAGKTTKTDVTMALQDAFAECD